ncbi:unnamed protein product [Diamesa serratosioi]
MKLLVTIVFAFLAVSAFADDNWEIDWSTVVPMTETPGFWDGRDFKPVQSSVRGGRIVGGNVAVPNAHPYQVGLLARVNIVSTGLCGGSIIAPRVILTAAHCVTGTQSIQVVMGAHRLTTATEPSQQRQTVLPAGYRVHVDYNPRTIMNDIATLILPNPAVYNQFVVPSVLPSGDEINNLFVGVLATVSGWGRINDGSSVTAQDLRYVRNNIMTNAVCANTFGAIIQPSNICMETTNGGSACNGDSGGPLTVSSGGRLVQVGIVSFGASAGCERGFPAAFVRVTSFLDWIAANSV